MSVCPTAYAEIVYIIVPYNPAYTKRLVTKRALLCHASVEYFTRHDIRSALFRYGVRACVRACVRVCVCVCVCMCA